jgi:alkaline phosphatase D
MKKTLVLLVFILASCSNNQDKETSGSPEIMPVSERKRIEYSPTKTAEIALGPFAGAVTTNSASFIVKTKSGAKVIIEVSENEDFSNPVYSNEVQSGKDNYFYVKPVVNGLAPDRKHFYRAIINGFPDTRVHYFFTFPEKEERSFTFGFGSCQQGYSQSNPALFPVIAKDSLKFFIHLGDWTYPDAKIARDYIDNMNQIEQSYTMRYDYTYPFVTDVLSKMGIAYVYDDHDFAGNDTDGSIREKQNAVTAYKMFFPHYSLPNGDNGIWQSFKYGDAEFFLLDLRTQRSPNRSALDASGKFDETADNSILAGYDINGENQRDWLVKSLKASNAKWKVIVSSVIFNPRYLDALRDEQISKASPRIKNGIIDKWAGYPKDIDVLLSTIKDNNIKNVIMVSGDSHSSYIDDGTNSVIPEISSSNLDVNNSNLGFLIMLAGYNIWNKGSYLDNGRAYGRISFVYGSTNYALMEVVNEKNEVVATHRVDAQ